MGGMDGIGYHRCRDIFTLVCFVYLGAYAFGSVNLDVCGC